jgi:carbon-monoxide dehydrogenase large subunit
MEPAQSNGSRSAADGYSTRRIFVRRWSTPTWQCLERYLVVEDCGAVTPLIVTGQQQGAVAMGISGVLLEEVFYDQQGQNRSGSFADYLLATAVEIPPMEIISLHTPNRRTPTGSKGMAEGGVMGAIGAVMNAVNDAIAPFGVVINRQPLRPDMSVR